MICIQWSERSEWDHAGFSHFVRLRWIQIMRISIYMTRGSDYKYQIISNDMKLYHFYIELFSDICDLLLTCIRHENVYNINIMTAAKCKS